jgi:hypothetical protein
VDILPKCYHELLIAENTSKKALCSVLGKVELYRAHKYILNLKFDKENSVLNISV